MKEVDSLPGVGGVDPRELLTEAWFNTLLTRPPKLLPDVVLFAYNLVLDSCDCCSLKFSNFTGDGMNPTSHPSLTNRPIHQSLLYFWQRTEVS